MATKQGLYTAALQALGERKFLTTESKEATRVLDNIYDSVLAECLQAGLWNFSMEHAQITGDTGIKPPFGYSMGFAKPTDWVRTAAISGDEYLSFPMLDYYDAQQQWDCDTTPLYVQYVSNDTGAGLELARWPALFTRYVELALAERICLRLTQDKELKEEIKKERDKAKRDALNKDAMDDANPKFKPPGSWTSSRGGRVGRERGSRNSLIG
jgi:hypothetical protein